MSPEDYLRVVAQKKPRLQALVDQAPQLTQEAIDALSEPLWVRQALSTLRTSGGKTQKDRVQDIVQRVIDAEAAAALLPKKTYEVRIWEGMPEFVGTDLGYQSGWKIQVETGDSFAILEDHKVQFGDSILTIDEHNMVPLMLNSKFVGYMTMELYKGFKQALTNQRHKNL